MIGQLTSKVVKLLARKQITNSGRNFVKDSSFRNDIFGEKGILGKKVFSANHNSYCYYFFNRHPHNNFNDQVFHVYIKIVEIEKRLVDQLVCKEIKIIMVRFFFFIREFVISAA